MWLTKINQDPPINTGQIYPHVNSPW